MRELNIATERGVVLNGALFAADTKPGADTVVIAITGIHGNFLSNPFYYNIGQTFTISRRRTTGGWSISSCSARPTSPGLSAG